MLLRTRLMIVCLASLALISLLIYGGLVHCNRSGHSDSINQQTDTAPDAQEEIEIAKPNGTRHKAMEACQNCHESDTPDEAKARELARQVPKLCYQCHEDESKTFAYVHGPVAVGQCLFCHDPHKSENAHLLVRDALELCALCHTRTDLATIENHQKPSHKDCLQCHTSHASDDSFLLKDKPS